MKQSAEPNYQPKRKLMRTLKIVLPSFLVIFLAFHFQMIQYLSVQFAGQIRILIKSKPIEKVLEKGEIADSTARKLRLVQEINAFAHGQLGLKGEKNYTTFYNQHGKPLMFVVEAAAPFSLEPYQWHFPIFGNFSYKGFFRESMAVDEQQRLNSLGYDTDIREVDAYSTLGILKDPVFSGILERDTGRLAEVIQHELMHATVFVKDSMELNENIATFIGHEAAREFISTRFGETDPALQRYNNWLKDKAMYGEHFRRAARQLKAFYQTLSLADTSKAQQLKRQEIAGHIHALDTIPFHILGNKLSDNPEEYNNAFFSSFLKYYSNQGNLKRIYQNRFEGNLPAFIRYLEARYE